MAGEHDDTNEDIVGLLIATPEKGSAEADTATGDDTADLDADDIDDGSPDDDGTEGDEPDDEEEGEADGDDEPEGSTNTDPLYTVTVDGKPKQITLKEALEGYSRTEDYTRKTTEVSAIRTEAETERATLRTAREQYSNVLEVLQQRIGSEADEPTQEQWNTLQAEDPDKYAVEWANHQRRGEQRTALKAEQDRVAKETHEERVKQANEFVAGERVKLLDKMPDWKEPTKFEAGMKVNREYAMKTLGFAENEVNAAYDHRFVLAIDKARRYDAIVARQAAAKKKIAAAPDIQAPGVRTEPKSRRQNERAAAEKKLNQTGRAEDAAALIMS
jgi:hypothetical protein